MKKWNLGFKHVLPFQEFLCNEEYADIWQIAK